MNYEIRYYTAPFLVTRGKDGFTPDVTTWCLSSGNRKVHTCAICKKRVEKGVPMWRPGGAFANAQNRMHRICQECAEPAVKQDEEPQPCPQCGGSGSIEWTGVEPDPRDLSIPVPVPMRGPCPACGGRGWG